MLGPPESQQQEADNALQSLLTQMLPGLDVAPEGAVGSSAPPAAAAAGSPATAGSTATANGTNGAGDASAVEGTEQQDAVLLSALACPLTGQPPQDPVLAPDGRTYERSALAAWLEKAPVSPVTGLPLVSAALRPNHTVMQLLQTLGC